METSDTKPSNSEGPDKPRRVMVFDFNGAKHMRMIADLADRKKWEAVYWFSSDKNTERRVERHFPDTQFIDKRDALALRWPFSVPAKTWPNRDEKVVETLAPHDPVLHSVFLREVKPKFGMEHVAEYHKRITQWTKFFDYARPDLLLYDNIPIHLYDFLPYILAHRGGIPTLCLLRPRQVPGVIMATNAYENPAPRVVSYYDELVRSGGYETAQLNEAWAAFYRRMSGDYAEAMPATFSRLFKVAPGGQQVKVRAQYIQKFGEVLRLMSTGKEYRVKLKSRLGEIKSAPRRTRLRWSYKRQSVEPDYSQPYVFVALHVQPERTSVPQGGVFGHQLLMVEMLSRALPEGWKLYVKEHPVQLYTRWAGKQFRTPEFYRELLKIPNVELISVNTSSHVLIQHARAVASATSNACWEAIYQGKPALVCGSVFFSFFEGIFHTQSREACAEVFEKIRDGYQVDQEKVRACLYAIQEMAIADPGQIVDDAMNVSDTDQHAWMNFIDELSSQIGEDGRIKPLSENKP